MRTSITALGIYLTATFGSQAAVILNGDFDTDGPAGNNFLANTPPTNWTLAATNQYWVGGTIFGPAPQSGNNYVALQSLSSANAAIYSVASSLTIGTTYDVSFYTFGGVQFGYDAATNWLFCVANTDGSSFSVISTGNNTSTTSWESHTASFVADATDKNIYFLVNSPTNGAGTYIDSVSIVPEPSTFAFLGLAVAALGISSRWRRSNHRA